MNSERWKQLERLFDEALALEPAQREAFLDAACGDDATMRRELRGLLAGNDRAGDFIERAISDVAESAARDLDRAPPSRATGSGEGDYLLPRLREAMTGRYRIEEELGSGGMAVVFGAIDRKHDREVAIKVLRPELSGVVTRQRFLSEIKLAARLTHPHILPLHDSGEAAGLLYYVMPKIDGDSVAQRLGRTSPLPTEEALGLAMAVASALDYAHRRDVVHRDIKPANILVQDGVAMVADFGIGKAMTAIEATDLTGTGVLVGTPAYMSPEQTEGAVDIDGRSDVYSLACVVFEMLTGAPPFTGPTIQSIVAQRLTQDAPPMGAARPGISPLLERVVARALARHPTQRYETAGAFGRDLAAAMAGIPPTVAVPTGPTMQSIAVLPFVNRTGDPRNEYLCDGFSEQLMNALSRIGGLRVVARTSAFAFKDRAEDVRTIGRKLGVAAVLEGGLHLADKRLRLTTQLIDVSDGYDLWSEQYDRRFDDVFDVQDEILQSIAEVFRSALGGGRLPRTPTGTAPVTTADTTPSPAAPPTVGLGHRSIPDLRAYEFYLRARHEIFHFTEDALHRAVEYLDKGLAILGDNVPLLSATGYAHWQFVNAGFSSDVSYLDRAEECASRIRTLAPDSPHGYRLHGLVAIHRGQPLVAVDYLLRALAGDPSDTDTLFWLTLMYGFLGRPLLAAPLAERLLEIDPLTALHRFLPGFLALMMGDFQAAPEPFEQALALDSTNPILLLGLAQAEAMDGRTAAALQTIDRLRRVVPDSFFSRLGRFFQLGLQGDRRAMDEVVTPALTGPAEADLQYAWIVAQSYAMLGESADAVRWLDRAMELGCANYPLLAKFDPLLEPLRSDPAFRGVTAKLKLRWEAAAAELERCRARMAQPHFP